MKDTRSLTLFTLLTMIPFFWLTANAEVRLSETEAMVLHTFEDVVGREPTYLEGKQFEHEVERRGLRRYELKRLIRREMGERRHYNSGFSWRSGNDPQHYDTRRWVESIFEERVGRLPTEEEMSDYCELCHVQDLDRRDLERVIREDYEGVWEPYYNDREYHYDYDRYTSSAEADYIVKQAYRDILHREPDNEGLRNYRALLVDEGWSERRLREHLENTPEALYARFSKIIIRAHEDLLDREPSEREIQDYLDKISRHRWDERELREQIKRGREYQYDRPKKLIDQAYREVLLREPDNATEGLRKEIVRKGWRLGQVKDHLRKSPEYRNITIPKMVRMAYLEVLEREPDPKGLQYYLGRARQGWTLEDIKKALRDSEEYRNRN